MPSPPSTPLAVDLDVLKLGTTEDPVSRDDVERALYALTGWQKPQHLVDAALDVVDSYAQAVRAGRVVPARGGHATVACGRAHLDEHTCPVTVRVVREPAMVPVVGTTSPYADTVKPARVRTGVRNEPTMTPAELLQVDGDHLAQLSDAQRAARQVLLLNTQGCSTCGEVKSLDAFYRDKARLTGHASRCKDCANAATSARRKTPG